MVCTRAVTYEEAFSPARALRLAFQALKRAPLLLAIGAVLLLVTEGDWVSAGIAAPPDDPAFRDVAPASRVVGALCCLSILWLVLLVAQSWLQPGYLRSQLAALRGEKPTAALLFSGRDRFLAMLGWKILAATLVVLATGVGAMPGIALAVLSDGQGTLATVGGILTIAGGAFAGIYVFLGLWLGDRVVTFEGTRPMQTLRRTWALAEGHRLRLFLFFVALAIVGLAGALGVVLFCVGALVTVPLAHVLANTALTDAYLRVASPSA